MTRPEDDALPVNAIADVRTEKPVDDRPAEQGPPPADYAVRPVPPVPAPAAGGLSAGEVANLVGPGSEEAVQTGRALEAAEGLNPDTES